MANENQNDEGRSHAQRRILFDDIEYYDIVVIMRSGSWCLAALVFPMALAWADNAHLQQREQSFTIRLNGSVDEVSPLFGPVRETEWAPGWSPRFLHPAGGGQQEGAVFTAASADGKERLWILTGYAPAEGRIEYTVVAPGFTANQIKIRVASDGPSHSDATITYRRSALSPEGNQEVAKLDAHWAQQQRTHWEGAINQLLAKHHD